MKKVFSLLLVLFLSSFNIVCGDFNFNSNISKDKQQQIQKEVNKIFNIFETKLEKIDKYKQLNNLIYVNKKIESIKNNSETSKYIISYLKYLIDTNIKKIMKDNSILEISNGNIICINGYTFKNGKCVKNNSKENNYFEINKDNTLSDSQTVVPGQSDVILWSAKIKTNSKVKVLGVKVEFDGNIFSIDNFSQLNLLVDNMVVSSYIPNNINSKSLVFPDSFTLSQDSKLLQITGDIKSDIMNNSSFLISKVDLGTNGVKYLSDDTSIDVENNIKGINTKIDINSGTNTNNNQDDTDISPYITPGAVDKLLLAFNLGGNVVSDTRVTKLSPELTLNGLSLDNITNVRLYQNNNLISTRNDFNFTGLNINIKKDTYTRFYIYADFLDGIAKGSKLGLNLGPKDITVINTTSNREIKVNSVIASAEFTFVSGGEINIKSNSSQMLGSIITPSNNETSIMKFDINASGDNARITDMYINNLMGNIDLSSAIKSVSMNINNNEFKGFPISKDKISFSFGDNGLLVKGDQKITGEIKVSFHDSNTRTNMPFQLSIKNGPTQSDEVSGTVNSMRVISESSGTEIIRKGGDINSNKFLIARSKPTISMSSGYIGTSTDLYRFNISSDQNSDINIKSITLTTSGTAKLGGANIILHKDSLSGKIIGQNSLDHSFTQGNIDFSNLNEKVSAGSTMTFYVELSNSDLTNMGDNIREVNISELVYSDDVDNPINIATSNYNVGLPTSVSSYRYSN